MAEFNTDIYKLAAPTTNVAPITPMQALQMLGQVNQNKLFQQEYASKDALAQAYKNNVGPDGKLNMSGLTRDSANAGFMAPGAVGQAIQNEGAQAKLDTERTMTAYQTLGSFAADKDLSLPKVAAWAATTAKNTGIPHEVVSNILDQAYRTGGNPQKLRQLLTGFSKQAMGNSALEEANGPPDPNTGAATKITKAESIDRRTGAIPAANAQQLATGMQTELPPGASKALETSGEVFASDLARARNYGAEIYPMTTALSSLERLGKTGTGPGTAELNTLKSFIQSNLSWLPGAEKAIGDPNSIKDFNEANKYLTQLAGSRAASFGHGTDQALATSLSANPNVHLDNLSAVDLTKAVIGLRRMEAAQALLASKQNINPGTYTRWAADFASKQDPRAYMVDQYDKEQLDRLQKSFKTKAEKQRFTESYRTAKELGLLNVGGAQNE